MIPSIPRFYRLFGGTAITCEVVRQRASVLACWFNVEQVVCVAEPAERGRVVDWARSLSVRVMRLEIATSGCMQHLFEPFIHIRMPSAKTSRLPSCTQESAHQAFKFVCLLLVDWQKREDWLDNKGTTGPGGERPARYSHLVNFAVRQRHRVAKNSRPRRLTGCQHDNDYFCLPEPHAVLKHWGNHLWRSETSDAAKEIHRDGFLQTEMPGIFHFSTTRTPTSPGNNKQLSRHDLPAPSFQFSMFQTGFGLGRFKTDP